MNEQILKAYSDLSKMEQLELERQETMISNGFQKWMGELNVSRSYVEPESFIRANELNRQYDFSQTYSKSSLFNFLRIKGIW